jgi:hypothetical protein
MIDNYLIYHNIRESTYPPIVISGSAIYDNSIITLQVNPLFLHGMIRAKKPQLCTAIVGTHLYQPHSCKPSYLV